MSQPSAEAPGSEHLSDRDSLLNPVTALRRAHPAWQIACESGVWTAVSHPAQNSQHIIAGPSFEALAAQLEQEDPR